MKLMTSELDRTKATIYTMITILQIKTTERLKTNTINNKNSIRPTQLDREVMGKTSDFRRVQYVDLFSSTIHIC